MSEYTYTDLIRVFEISPHMIVHYVAKGKIIKVTIDGESRYQIPDELGTKLMKNLLKKRLK